MARKTPPNGISAPQRFSKDYERKIKALVLNPMLRGIERAIDEIHRDYQAGQAINRLPREKDLQGKATLTASRHISALERWHRQRVQATIMRYWGIDGSAIMRDATVRPLMLEFIQTNVELITRVDADTRAKLIDRIQQTIMDAPGDRDAIAKAVRKEMQIAGRRVRLIARDQTSKAVGQLNRVRQVEAGIESYVWSDSGDARVRPTHVENNGHTFEWRSPPEATGHPGDDIQCRCIAIPVMPSKPPRPR